MQENGNMDELRERFIKMCPDVITTISDMLGNPETPGSVKVQLIAIVLDRAMGKPETPVKVTTTTESFEEAEIELMAMVRQIQIDHGMIPMGEEMMEMEPGTAGIEADSGETEPGRIETEPGTLGIGAGPAALETGTDGFRRPEADEVHGPWEAEKGGAWR